MATQAYNRFSSNSGPPGGTPPPTGSPQRLALDNLIRRELRVADPTDSQQVAQALLARYKADPRAAAITQEALGLPFLNTMPAEPRMAQAPTSSDAELQQGIDDVERDLQELTTSNLLKDVTPELEGWATAVRSVITEGATAARFALDPRQRDKAFGNRRQLGDFSRMARLIGALTPAMSPTYRKFAQSVDEVAAVLLVLMGEALANVGFNGGQFLLQVPYTELQVRRDAAIYALRNLVGAAQEAYGPNDWPRGLDAYRNLFRALEAQGQGDLRALLLETELARTMDALIQRADHGRAEGLRALGATARLDLQRFRRLVVIGQNVVAPPSPSLTAFLEALLLFAEAFDSSGGFRLLRIARPPILFYGLYGVRVVNAAEGRLLNLILKRNLLADRLDCFMQCGCTTDEVRCQILLDKVLYDVDRAIDLYALGKEDYGIPEHRAAAYGYVIESLLPGFHWPGVGMCPDSPIFTDITTILTDIKKELILPSDRLQNLKLQNLLVKVIKQELGLQQTMELQWRQLVETMAPNCTKFEVFDKLEDLIQGAIDRLNLAIGKPQDEGVSVYSKIEIDIPSHFESTLEKIREELATEEIATPDGPPPP